MTRRWFLRHLAWSASALVALGGGAACAPFASAPAPTPTPTEEALGRGSLGLLAAESTPAAAEPTTPPSDPTPAPPDPTAAVPPTPVPIPTATPVPSPTPIPAPRQPNVLLVSVDTLRSDHVGAYGFARAHTPTLDRLAAEGVRFDRVVCQLPQTNASHAALLTGLFPSTSGVKVHMVDKLAPGRQTMAGVFAAAGYQTAGIYSWVSLDPQFCGLNQGFQTYDGYVTNRSLLFSDPRLEGLMALYRQVKANVPVVRTADVAFSGSDQVEKSLDGRADITTPPALQWLDQHAGGADPFFMWLHYYDPHYPYTPPAGFDHILGLNYHGKIDGSIDTLHAIDKGQITPTEADVARLEELYQGEIAFMDSQLQQVLELLQSRGVLDDTIVVLTGDHGESFGEHDDWMHGLQVFESEIHVPLFLRYPRQVPPGQTAAWPVQHVDVMPTLLDLAGIKAKKEVQGVSFAPLITGKPTKQSGSTRVGFTELADESFVSLVTTEWKLIRNDANGDLQLYHISQDDRELRNLVDDQPQTARDINARLQEMMKYAGVSK